MIHDFLLCAVEPFGAMPGPDSTSDVSSDGGDVVVIVVNIFIVRRPEWKRQTNIFFTFANAFLKLQPFRGCTAAEGDILIYL